MKAILKDREAPGAKLSDVEAPKPRPDEILIKVHRASICGSDLSIYHWRGWAPGRVKPPMVFGHEFSGTVEEAGPEAGDFKKGDFVSVESHIYCGRCLQCRSGQKQVCAEMKLIGVDAPGGFGEMAAVPGRCAFKHRSPVFRDLGSLFEPFGNAVYAVSAEGEDVSGLSILVLGCGPQGLFAVSVARAMGARTVVAVEGSPFRSRLALKMGADAVIPPGPDALSRVRDTGRVPGGFDVVLELSGNPEAVNLAMKAVRAGGRVTAFGLPPGPVSIDWGGDLIFKGVRVHGIVGRRIFETWETAWGLLESGAVDLRPAVTHTLPFNDFEEGFRLMSAPEKACGKVVLAP